MVASSGTTVASLSQRMLFTINTRSGERDLCSLVTILARLISGRFIYYNNPMVRAVEEPSAYRGIQTTWSTSGI